MIAERRGINYKEWKYFHASTCLSLPYISVKLYAFLKLIRCTGGRRIGSGRIMVRDVPANAWEEGEYRGAEPYRPPRERERDREREHTRPNNDRYFILQSLKTETWYGIGIKYKCQKKGIDRFYPIFCVKIFAMECQKFSIMKSGRRLF